MLFKNKNVLIFIVALVTIIITVNFALTTSKSMNPIGNALHKRQDPKDTPKDGEAPPPATEPPPPSTNSTQTSLPEPTTVLPQPDAGKVPPADTPKGRIP